MIELLAFIGLIWDFYEGSNIILRIYKTLTHYFKFVFWFLKNPKVRMKYTRLIYVSGNYSESLKKISNLLKSGTYEFTDGVIEQENRLIFEFKDTRMGYQIRGYPLLKEGSHNLRISTIFYNIFPFRELNTINDIKKDFYKLCELIRKIGLKMGDKNETIFLEIQLKNKKEIKSNFIYKDCKISFANNKIQIDNTYGSEFNQLILFILAKWLIEN